MHLGKNKNMFNNLYKNKKVLVTGHTGFKGSWLSSWLIQLGAKVLGYSNNIPSQPSHFEKLGLEKKMVSYFGDVRDYKTFESFVKKHKPEIVFHMAAQPIVTTSFKDPLETIQTNVMGVTNILEIARKTEYIKSLIIITSDKCYENVEWTYGYRETDRLGGKDPYSASKAMAELVIQTFYESYFHSDQNEVRIGISRAGNVIGGGDWAKDRIIADCMRAWSRNIPVNIRNPNSTRPWQHVLEPLSGYLTLGHFLSESTQYHGEAYNFGPSANVNHSVEELIKMMKHFWKEIEWTDLSSQHEEFHEAGLLKLNCDKALSHLRWEPALNFEDTIRMTIEWYRKYYLDNSVDMQEFTNHQIAEYTDLASEKNIYWTNETD